MKHQKLFLCCLHHESYYVLLWKAITKNYPLTHQYTFYELYVKAVESLDVWEIAIQVYPV